MNDTPSSSTEEELADLVFESQATIQRTQTATDDVFDLVKRFVHLYAQLPTKPAGAALLYQECGSLSARFRDLEQKLTIGRLSKSERNPDGSDLAVEDAQMSRRHFEIVVSDGFHILRDLGSRNGTYVNNDPEKIQEKLLKAGDVILAGTSLFVFSGAPFAEELSSD